MRYVTVEEVIAINEAVLGSEPDAHGKVIESWTRRLGAPVAHETAKAPSR